MTSAAPIVAVTRTAYAQAVAAVRRERPGTRLAVVMTMGALHDGHARLMQAAREAVGPDGVVVVTVFVNPLQFGPGEDFARYPRAFDADLARCAATGVDIVLAPTVAEVYGSDAGPDPNAVTVDPGPLGAVLEGAVRPGHFRGVLTVVLKLLHLTGPDVALFGEKDYQQLTLIRRLARDLDVPVEIRGVDTVRDADGLALSSRNAYLAPAERAAAADIPRALRRGVSAARFGAGPDQVVALVRAELAAESRLLPDYVVVTDPDLGPPPRRGPARLLVAVRVGSTRLLDTMPLDLGGGG